MARGPRLSLFLLLAICVAAAEAASRLFWAHTKGLPFLNDFRRVVQCNFPGMQALYGIDIGHDDGIFDILLLGGSVLHDEWGQVEELLRERLTRRANAPWRIHNLSYPAHSSRDSLLKYRSLTDKSFDLVIIYDSINDVRHNGVPERLFREDYSHAPWYRLVNGMGRLGDDRLWGWSAIPATLLALRVKADDPLDGMTGPSSEAQRRQDVVRTVEPLRSNLSEILQLAKERQEAVLMMTFSYHMPANYSLEAFRKRTLDYGKHKSPVEIWGPPPVVEQALKAHNRVISDLARAHSALFVDQNRLIPKSKSAFDDICHLTRIGSALFVSNIENVVLERIASFQARRAASSP